MKLISKSLGFWSTILLVPLMQSCSCCNHCLPVPTTDNTPPTAGMVIEYFKDGKSNSETLSANDASTTVHADGNRPVTILYSGGDNDGLKSVQIIVTVFINNGGLQQRQDYNIAPIVSSCPVSLLLSTFKFDQPGSSRNIKVGVKSINWLGMVTNTQSHYVSTELN